VRTRFGVKAERRIRVPQFVAVQYISIRIELNVPRN